MKMQSREIVAREKSDKWRASNRAASRQKNKRRAEKGTSGKQPWDKWEALDPENHDEKKFL